MSSRGRGYGSSRGSSYRGNRGSWGGDSRSNRGSGYTSSRGGGPPVGSRYWGSSNLGNSSHFDSRSSSKYGSSNSAGRYSSRGGRDDYKRPYRPDSSYVSSRDLSGHRSPERKRIRSEVQGDRSPRVCVNTSYFTASSSRRSHENSFGNYGSAGGSHHRYEGSGRFSSERRPSFTAAVSPPERRESDTFRPPRSDYHKPAPSPRGTFRGRASGRGSFTRRDSALITKRRIVDTSRFAPRRRGVINIRSSDYMRRLRLQRIRSAVIRRSSFIKRKAFRARVTDSDKDSDRDDSDDSMKKKTDEKSLNGDSKSKEDKNSEKEDEKDEQNFIKLVCPQCKMRCQSFKDYSVHLYSSRHSQAMRRASVKQRALLSRMRVLQRHKQRELDKEVGDPKARTNFCLLCKLNYKQLKEVHQSSEAHKEIKRFLMPRCKICSITFSSPMLYENHICSLQHIKTRAKVDPEGLKKDEEKDNSKSTDKEDVFLENFLTIDSVGDVDDENESDKQVKKETTDDEEEEEVVSKPKKDENVIGKEHIPMVEVPYCRLCRIFLLPRQPSSSDGATDRLVQKHCRTRLHLQRYIKRRDDHSLREAAERIHRKAKAEKESEDNDGDVKKQDKEDPKKSSTDVEPKSEKKADDEEANTDNVEEKLWADVNILGDLIRQESGNKSTDEEDEKHDRSRYDRFGYSEDAAVVAKTASAAGKSGGPAPTKGSASANSSALTVAADDDDDEEDQESKADKVMDAAGEKENAK